MAISVAARMALPVKGGVRLVMASQPSNVVLGASGIAIHGMPAGTATAWCSHRSSLPTNNRLAPLCSSTKRMVSAVSVGKMATVVQPAIQMANSAIKKWAQFFDRMATRAPGSKPWDLRWFAIRRAWSMVCAQV